VLCVENIINWLDLNLIQNINSPQRHKNLLPGGKVSLSNITLRNGDNMGDELNIFNEWGTNWKNAKRFFDSKGNTKTKARLKKEWQDSFFDTAKKVYLR